MHVLVFFKSRLHCFFLHLRKLLQTQMSLKNRPCSSFARFSAYRGRSRIEMSSFSLHWLQSFTRTLKKVTPLNNSFDHKKLIHQNVVFAHVGGSSDCCYVFSCSILWLQRPHQPDPDGSLNDVHPVTCPQPLRQLDSHLTANCSSQIPRPSSDTGAALQPRWKPNGP